jgi:hypothetical protein
MCPVVTNNRALCLSRQILSRAHIGLITDPIVRSLLRSQAYHEQRLAKSQAEATYRAYEYNKSSPYCRNKIYYKSPNLRVFDSER